MAATLYDLIPRDEKPSNDVLLGRFLEYAEGRRLQLYPAQEAAILELFEDKNVILNTPTGLGQIARGHGAALSRPSPRAGARSTPARSRRW